MGNEDRMASKRCLLAVIGRVCRGKPLRNKIPSVYEHYRQGLLAEISKFRRPEIKALSKRRICQGLENMIDVVHTVIFAAGA